MSAHSVLAIIDEHKEDLGDRLYKNLCDELAKLSTKTKPKFVKFTGTEALLSNSQWFDEDDNVKVAVPDLIFSDKVQICQIDDECIGGGDIENGKVSNDVLKLIKHTLTHHPTYKDVLCYNDGKIKGYFLITKVEDIE